MALPHLSCLSFWVPRRTAALHPSVIEMLGGSEFRLRQGFAYGKTLVTRHSARPPAGGICHVGKLQLRKSLRAFSSAGRAFSSLPNRIRSAAVGGFAALRMRRTPCGCSAGFRFGSRSENIRIVHGLQKKTRQLSCLRLSKKSIGLFQQPSQCLAFLPAHRAEKLPLRGANAC